MSETKPDDSITILKGHVSPETAYVVDDYPFGFRARCKIRYWLEYHKTYGVRMVSQTTSPKTNQWNKPKPGTYSRFGECMFLDQNGHVKIAGLTEYSTYAEAKAWQDKYGEGVPEEAKLLLDTWVKAKKIYEEKTASRMK